MAWSGWPRKRLQPYIHEGLGLGTGGGGRDGEPRDHRFKGLPPLSASFTNDLSSSPKTAMGNTPPPRRNGRLSVGNSIVSGAEEHVRFLAGRNEAFFLEEA